MKTFFLSLMLGLCCAASASADGKWHVVRSLPQVNFRHAIPPGNYSGIARLHDDVYTMVSDKSDSALFFNVRLYISKQTGELINAEYLGESGKADAAGLDNEAIARVTDSTVVVASEGKYRLKEFLVDGSRVAGDAPAADHLWEWSMPAADFYGNYAFESAAYDSLRNCLWTINESCLRRDGKPASTSNISGNVLRLMSFDWASRSTSPKAYLYKMDIPTTMKTAQTYAFGVSELCVLPDGKLLVLEREAFVPKMKIGAFCNCKLYVVDPDREKPYALDKPVEPGAPFVEKRLLTSWRTTMSIFSQSWANYEGMCLGPQLDNGDQVIILVSDSQDGYAGMLRDWFKTIVVSDK